MSGTRGRTYVAIALVFVLNFYLFSVYFIFVNITIVAGRQASSKRCLLRDLVGRKTSLLGNITTRDM